MMEWEDLPFLPGGLWEEERMGGSGVGRLEPCF